MAKFVPDEFGESEDVLTYARQAKAENTRRAYAADWRDFVAYARSRGHPVLPADADTVAP